MKDSINLEDVQFDTYAPGWGPVAMILTHWPTGIVIERKGHSTFLLRKSLLKELEEQLLKGETNGNNDS